MSPDYVSLISQILTLYVLLFSLVEKISLFLDYFIVVDL